MPISVGVYHKSATASRARKGAEEWRALPVEWK
jgi:hypothetical protein